MLIDKKDIDHEKQKQGQGEAEEEEGSRNPYDFASGFIGTNDDGDAYDNKTENCHSESERVCRQDSEGVANSLNEKFIELDTVLSNNVSAEIENGQAITPNRSLTLTLNEVLELGDTCVTGSQNENDTGQDTLPNDYKSIHFENNKAIKRTRSSTLDEVLGLGNTCVTSSQNEKNSEQGTVLNDNNNVDVEKNKAITPTRSSKLDDVSELEDTFGSSHNQNNVEQDTIPNDSETIEIENRQGSSASDEVLEREDMFATRSQNENVIEWDIIMKGNNNVSIADITRSQNEVLGVEDNCVTSSQNGGDIELGTVLNSNIDSGLENMKGITPTSSLTSDEISEPENTSFQNKKDIELGSPNDNFNVDLENSRPRSSTSDDVSQLGVQDWHLFQSFLENNPSLWDVPEPSDQEDWIETVANEVGSKEDVSSVMVMSGNEQKVTDTSVKVNQQKNVKAYTEAQFRALVVQLLKGQNIKGPDHVYDKWSEIIASLASDAAGYIKPGLNLGKGMDPGGYVKVKYVVNGQPSESQLVKGIVCERNVAHKRMKTNIEYPRLLVLRCALDLAPHQLSSVKTMLEEDENNLSTILSKIEEFHPNVLLVGNAVSRQAQEWALGKDISLVVNVKKSLLERISRCTDATIIENLDDLIRKPITVGQCEHFYVEKYIEKRITDDNEVRESSKSLMFFKNCPKPFGCTVLLHGSNENELKKLKEVAELAVFAAYHLALETSFLADECANLVEFHRYLPLKIALPDKKSKSELSISIVSDFSASTSQVVLGAPSVNLPVSGLPISTIGLNNLHSDNESFPMGERSSEFGGISEDNLQIKHPSTELKAIDQQSKATDEGFSSLELDSVSDSNNQHGHVPKLTHKEFPPTPSDHQSILVSFSSILKKGIVCRRGDLRRITYYGTFDEPLGTFLKGNILSTTYRCPFCEHTKEEHVDCYTHQQGSLTIFVHKQNSALPGDGGKIWMWYRCLKCPWIDRVPRCSQRVVMSNSACDLSFGKFLELNFSRHAAASRLASCGHSVHHHCLRFYGLGNMIACFRYAPANVYSVNLPPSMLEFNYSEHEDWLQKEVKEIAEKGETFFKSISSRLHDIKEKEIKNVEEVLEIQNSISELENMLSTQGEGFKIALQNATSGHGAYQPRIDILQLNKIRRTLSKYSIMWESRIQSLLSSSKSSKPGFTVLSFLKDISIGSGRIKHPEENQDFLVDKGHNLVVPNVQTIQGTRSLEFISKEGEDIMTMSDKARPKESGSVDRRLNSLARMDTMEDSNETKSSERPDEHVKVLPDGGSGTNLNESNSGPSEPVPSNQSSKDIKVYGASSEVHNFVPSSLYSFINTFNEEGTSEYRISDEDSSEEHIKNLDDLNIQLSEDNGKKLDNGYLQSVDSQEPSAIEGWVGATYASFCDRDNTDKELEAGKSQENLDPSATVSTQSFSPPILDKATGQEGSTVEIEETMISLYDDEPTSIIAYAIASQQYKNHLPERTDEKKKELEEIDDKRILDNDDGLFHSLHWVEGSSYLVDGNKNSSNGSASASSTHVKIDFTGDSPRGKINCSVTFYYAQNFESLRSRCCRSIIEFIRSLCRCKKWGAEGGKSKVYFAKTADDRFVVKQITRTELDSFMTFASAYFEYITDSLKTGSPTGLAKILGIYQVMVKHVKGGKEVRMDLMIMENLLYGRHVTRIYDLKGSLRSRYNADMNRKDAVLLDQNMVDSFPNNPIFISTKDKRLLERAVWNDTAFLASVDVMDYSLLVGIDEDRRHLYIGIIDFMRQYTWDKQFETWVKTSGILGGPKKTPPTVISPEQYKKRFRKAMSSYFLKFPDITSTNSIDSPEEALVSDTNGSVDDSQKL